MKAKSLAVAIFTVTVFLTSCSKTQMNRDENIFSIQQSKESPEFETASITGTINPADVNAVIYAWNEQFTSEPVRVSPKDGSFTLVVPALDYYHLTITYISPSTGNEETHIKPKNVVQANATTNVGVIELE